MKTLQSLTQQLDQWRRLYKLLRSSLLLDRLSDRIAGVKARMGLGLGSKARARGKRGSVRPRKRLPVVLLLAVVSLTGTMGNHFYNAPKLNVDTISPETIRAPYDANVEDVTTTEEKRKEARTGAVPVLMLDQDTNQKIYADLQRIFERGDKVREIVGTVPFVPTTVLSTSAQVSLRSCPEWEWQTVLSQINEPGATDLEKTKDLPPLASSSATNSLSESASTIFSVLPAVVELQSYRKTASSQEFSALIKRIKQARQQYTKALTTEPDSGLQTTDLAFIVGMSETAWQQTQMGVRETAIRMLTQGIPPGLPSSILQEAVKTQLSSLVPPTAQSVATQILLRSLRPNLKEDKEQTKQLAEQAALAVKPVMLSVNQGEVIVSEGDVINHTQFVLLDHFGLSRRAISGRGLIWFASLVCGGILIFWLVQRRFHPNLRQRDHLLVLLLTLSTPILVTLNLPYPNLPAIGLLVGSFYGFPLGVTVVGLLTGILSISFGTGWDYLVASAAGAILVSLMAGKLRSREELAFLGCAVGLTQGGIYLFLNLFLSAAAGSVFLTVLEEAALYGLSGLAWSIVALGLSPYLEHLFDIVTPIRLAELANPNRPLLKRLAAETPGTFQHTLLVATLAEAAARTLGCNVELVRTGTLYHDIGKMHDPLAFIENQMGGPNKHDQINDPWKSAEIIKKHVSEGLVMARKYRLPKAVQAFIPEHQGTILIAYFYYQAQVAVAETEAALMPPVDEANFRYDGPVPQSRETGIVMLADACEAALRSLKDVSPEQALSTIHKILRARWQDNQLVDSELRREDLAIIGEVFLEVWQQCNHQRIAYPKLAGSK